MNTGESLSFSFSNVAALAMIAGLCSGASAQSLPGYQPSNPMLASRSPLGFQSFVDRSDPTRYSLGLDYASLVEYIEGRNRFLLIDGEFARLTLGVTWNGSRVFGGLSLTFNAVFPGVLDSFLNWYHDAIGLEVKPRGLRPTDEFAYLLIFTSRDTVVRERKSRYLGDPLVFLGLHHGDHWQSRIVLSLPLAPSAYGRRGVSGAVFSNGKYPVSGRVNAELSLGFGLTPRSGDLAGYQRTIFASGSAGMSARFSQRHRLYLNLFHQTASYEDSGLPPMDRPETTLDLGVLLRFSDSGPLWLLGMTEDLDPLGPAVDLVLRLGAHW